MMLAIFGQLLDDKDLLDDCAECQEPTPAMRKLRQIVGVILPMIAGWKPIEKQKRKLFAIKPVKREDFLDDDRFDKLFHVMCSKFPKDLFPTAAIHVDCTQLSAMCNGFLMGILSISGGLRKQSFKYCIDT